MQNDVVPHTLPRTLIWPADDREMALIPAGEFVLGDDQSHWADQKPAHVIYCDAFYMDRYPVTNAAYRRFVEASGHGAPEHWPRGQMPPGLEHHPVVNLSWNDASAYARWAGKRLPTEAEWEKAASWDPVRRIKTRFPWGDHWDAACGNIMGRGGLGATTPVTAHSPQGDSPSGVADLIGNVWEWCSTAMAPYPYRPDDGRQDPGADVWRVLRGAGWDTVLERDACCAFRYSFPPGFSLPSLGCRCAVSSDMANEQIGRLRA